MIPKYRVYDKIVKIIRPVATINFDAEEVSYWFTDSGETYCPFTECVLMQSTGLKDKNSVEIFEGDIVKWKDCEPVDELDYEDIFVVNWSDEFLMWKARNEDTDYIDLYDYSDSRELEVLGNIYENKELLG